LLLSAIQSTPQQRGFTVNAVTRQVATAQMTWMPCRGESGTAVQNPLIVKHHRITIAKQTLSR